MVWEPATTATSDDRRLRFERSSLEDCPTVVGGLEADEADEVFPDKVLWRGLGFGGTAGELRELVEDSDPVLGLGEAAPEVR